MGYKINIYDGSQWVNILDHDYLNNVKGSAEGYHLSQEQYGYIDQDVTIGSSPAFYNTNMSGNISIWENDANYLVMDDVKLQVFEQDTPASTWTINHNYGTKYVLTQAYGDDDVLIQPNEVELVDNNTLTLTFDTAITGYVLYSTMIGTAPSSTPAADHGSLTGLLSDDHTQYSFVNGTRGFTGPISGVDPTISAHLTTKFYVDNKTWVANDITDFADAVTNHSDVAANTTHRTSDGSDHAFIDQDVTIGSAPQFSNTNMYGSVSQWTNDVGYIKSDTLASLNASDTAPAVTEANDLWVEFV